MTVSVFLLDDHEIVRRGLRELLELSGDIRVVGESGSAQEAERRIPALRPDVSVLDARLPDGSGIDVCRNIRAVDPTLRAIILTSSSRRRAIGSWAFSGSLATCCCRSASSCAKRDRGHACSPRDFWRELPADGPRN